MAGARGQLDAARARAPSTRAPQRAARPVGSWRPPRSASAARSRPRRRRPSRPRARPRPRRRPVPRARASSGARRSANSSQRSGIVFVAPGATVSRPIVATAPGSERATSCASTTKRAAAPSASERSGIGTVPAWPRRPENVSSRPAMPAIELTMPSGAPGRRERRALLDVRLDEARGRAARASRRAAARRARAPRTPRPARCRRRRADRPRRPRAGRRPRGCRTRRGRSAGPPRDGRR